MHYHSTVTTCTRLKVPQTPVLNPKPKVRSSVVGPLEGNWPVMRVELYRGISISGNIQAIPHPSACEDTGIAPHREPAAVLT